MRPAALAVVLAALLYAPVAATAAEIGQSTLGNVFVRGERVVLPVRGVEPGTVWTIKDFFGVEAASGRVGAATIEPKLDATGYFTAELGGDRKLAQAAFAIVPPPRPSPESPFGVMTHFAKGWSLDIMPLISRAGIGRMRDEQPWRQVEKKRGAYDFPARLTAYMDAAAAQNLDPLLVLAFANPHYDGGKTPTTAAGRAGFAAYADAVTRRYGSRIRALEVWNEYNGSFCNGPCREDRPAAYTALLRDSYRTLKSRSPAVTVLGGAAVQIPIDWFQKLFSHGALQSMDAVVIHPYRKRPEGVEERIAELRASMERHGGAKPIWATEYGDIADMKKSRDDVARYLVRMSVLLRAAGVERMYWYLLRDYAEFAGLGLVRDENDPLGRYAPNPAYPAYAVLIDRLARARFVKREPSPDDAYVYLFMDEGGHELRVAWADAPRPYRIPEAGPARIYSMMGGELDGARDASSALTLGRNPIYIVR